VLRLRRYERKQIENKPFASGWVSDWTLSLNAVDCVYIDFSKAFDSVVYSKLYLKLTPFGFQGKLLHWIAAFLHGRTHSVRVGKILLRSL